MRHGNAAPRRLVTAFTTALLLLVPLSGLSAQEPAIQLRGRGEPALDSRIRQLLREPGWTVWTRDTLVARGDTVRDRVLVVGPTVRIEGTLLRELVSIGGDVFVRPGGRLLGPVHSIAGGWYPSSQASLEGEVTNEPLAPYEIERTDDAIIIRGTTHRRLVSMEPVIPTYDRVDGLSLGVGGALRLPPLGRVETSLHARGTYRSERGQFDPGAELRARRGGTSLGLGAERTTLSNQAWSRSDLSNSVNYLFLGKDVREYYEAERAWVELRRLLRGGESRTEVRLRGQVEDATSLTADDPWSLFKEDSVRANGYPADGGGARSADAGRITSVLAGVNLEWERPTWVTEFDAFTEVGVDALDSDYRFARYETTAEIALQALRDHTLEFDLHFRGPLPGSTENDTELIPRQRWSSIGGSGTLYTFELGQFFGDRVAYVETTYSIPLGRRFRTPYLGIPSLDLLHVAGMAWQRGGDRGFEQNVGLRLGYSVAYLRVVSNPDRLADDAEFSVGLRFPRGTRPWEPPGGFF